MTELESDGARWAGLRTVVAGLIWALLGAAMFAPLPFATTADATTSPFAMLAGVTTSSSVTSLACYDTCPGTGAHAYTEPNPVDMGTLSNQPPVYVQNDYLPDEIEGGYFRAYRVMTGCGALEGGDYNGRRVKIELYYWDDGGYVNWNHESYLHIDPDSSVDSSSSGAIYYIWNNAYATTPWVPSWVEDFKMNNLTSGGRKIGDVTEAAAEVEDCWYGNHLHQESDGDGDYATNLDVGDTTTARITDVHYVTLSGIAGEAP